MLPDLELTGPIGYLGTGRGTIEVLMAHSPSYYQLHADRDDFDALLATLIEAWKRERPVRATIRGTTIVSVELA